MSRARLARYSLWQFRDFAIEREFERIRKQVENNLLPHVSVYVDVLANGRTIDDQT